MKTVIELIDERDKAIDAAREATRIKYENEVRVEMLTRAIIATIKHDQRVDGAALVAD